MCKEKGFDKAVEWNDTLGLRDSKRIGGQLRVGGKVYVSNLPDHIALRMKESAEWTLVEKFGPSLDVDIEVVESDGMGKGTGITLWTEASRNSGCDEGDGINGGGRENEAWMKQTIKSTRLGASARGERGVKAKTVGEHAARKLITEIEGGGGVDIHLADQLPVFSPIIMRERECPGLHYTVREISGHLRTGLWLLEQFGYTGNTLYREGFHILL